MTIIEARELRWPFPSERLCLPREHWAQYGLRSIGTQVLRGATVDIAENPYTFIGVDPSGDLRVHPTASDPAAYPSEARILDEEWRLWWKEHGGWRDSGNRHGLDLTVGEVYRIPIEPKNPETHPRRYAGHHPTLLPAWADPERVGDYESVRASVVLGWRRAWASAPAGTTPPRWMGLDEAAPPIPSGRPRRGRFRFPT